MLFDIRLFQPVEEQRLIRWIFIRFLALIYSGAFISLSIQIGGLVGPQGILPLDPQLNGSYQELGRGAWLWLPTLFWIIEPSDSALQATGLIGVILSLRLVVTAGWERLTLVALFVLYLSLVHAGQIFTNFQWDALLLEAGFLAIFLGDVPSRLVILLYEWLLFRLRFMSGYFKLASDDPSWSGFSALKYYFETQPLPHIGAWYFHHLPEWVVHALKEQLPLPMHQFADSVRRFGIGNIYHVFPTMQVERQELVVEGSNDGEEWHAYRFRYTPGELDKTPPFIIPHQPRLDWMVWFVPTQQLPQMLWFGEFLNRLHEGSPSVTGLMAYNPFPESPPHYLRVLAYRYTFTSASERAESGNWWRREYLGQFPQVKPRRP